MKSWDRIWKKKQLQTGPFHRIGTRLATYGDLQRLVLEVLRRNYRINGNTAVLEVGCGSGPVAGRLIRSTPLVFGVDISKAAVALTKSRGVKTVRADARELPFCKEAFALVYTVGVVDLFDHNQASVIIREIARVTETGGRMVIVTAWSGCHIHEAVKNYLIRKKRWSYGPKRTFRTLEHLLPPECVILREKAMGALFQFRFLSYLFEDKTIVRRLYHLVYLLLSIILWPLNRLPGAVLVTTMEKR